MRARTSELAAEPWPKAELEWIGHCPICGDERRTLLYRDLVDRVFFCAPGMWALHRCTGCKSAYLDPRPTSESIGQAYSSYYTHRLLPELDRPVGLLARLKRASRDGYLNTRYGFRLSPASVLGGWAVALLPPFRVWVDRRARNLQLRHGARLLDIGCGQGDWVRDALSWGWDAEGMDPDQNAVALGRSLGLKISHGSLPRTEFPDGSFSAVTMSHSIEHLHDPAASLHEIYRILAPGGAVWLATPNLESAGHKAFGRNWLHLDPPRHLVVFTPDSLSGALGSAGFENVRRLRPAFSATDSFTASYRLGLGEFLAAHDGSRLPVRSRLKADAADWRALLAPECGEEMVLMATRP